jgi:CRISPR-associated protein Cas2
MWMMVLFDLPVMEKEERKAATDFRNYLLDDGFEMAQFSVYARFCTSQGQIDALVLQVKKALPPGGKIDIMFFTDKQYERNLSFRGKRQEPPKKAPDQFALF